MIGSSIVCFLSRLGDEDRQVMAAPKMTIGRRPIRNGEHSYPRPREKRALRGAWTLARLRTRVNSENFAIKARRGPSPGVHLAEELRAIGDAALRVHLREVLSDRLLAVVLE